MLLIFKLIAKFRLCREHVKEQDQEATQKFLGKKIQTIENNSSGFRAGPDPNVQPRGSSPLRSVFNLFKLGRLENKFSTMSPLEGLPQPALARVLSYMGFTDLTNLRSTCTALHQALKELTTGILAVTKPEEMCVQSNRLILGLNLVLNTDEEMLKAMLRSFPKLETLARSHKYKAGRLKFSVTPMNGKVVSQEDQEVCFKGKVAKNMLSPWGHHLLGHHYLDMLLALHTRLSLPLSHLDLQVN